MKQFLGLTFATLFVALQTAAGNLDVTSTSADGIISQGQTALYDTGRVSRSNGMVDFVAAARAAMPAVVHVKVRFNASANDGASGSGVIISEDGYIATNNHVVDNTSEISVTLTDKRTYKAKLIGRDPNTDLALLKIEASNLPAIKTGNSDILQVGEWVLAVGFPLSLNTTVTAGIVSAKARSIGIIGRSSQAIPVENQQNSGRSAVESFIQTDAAINPGNSGGALVNTDGELIGINSAIASQTGSYAGYAFAIPVNLASKILDDLKAYGEVRRGVLGVSFPSPSDEDRYMVQNGLNPASIKGVFITGVQPGSAAAMAGLRAGDIIQNINGIELNSSTEFSERIARQKPGDVIKLNYLRSNQSNTVSVTLKGEEQVNVTKATEPLRDIYRRLGASFSPLTNEMKERFSIKAGVQVASIQRGGFFDQIGIPAGTVIAFINGQAINSPRDIEGAFLSVQSGMIRIFAIAPDGSKVIFDFSLGT